VVRARAHRLRPRSPRPTRRLRRTLAPPPGAARRPACASSLAPTPWRPRSVSMALEREAAIRPRRSASRWARRCRRRRRASLEVRATVVSENTRQATTTSGIANFEAGGHRPRGTPQPCLIRRVRVSRGDGRVTDPEKSLGSGIRHAGHLRANLPTCAPRPRRRHTHAHRRARLSTLAQLSLTPSAEANARGPHARANRVRDRKSVV